MWKLFFYALLISYTKNKQTDVCSGNGKQKTVASVKYTAMAGNKVSGILYADHALEKRFGKVTDLTKGRCHKSGDNTYVEGNMAEPWQSMEKDAGSSCSYGTADTALHTLLGGHMGSNLMLAESQSTEESEGIAYPCGQSAQSQGLQPDSADADHHQQAKEKTGIGHSCKGIKSTVARHFSMQDSGEQSKINTHCKTGGVCDNASMEKGQNSL